MCWFPKQGVIDVFMIIPSLSVDCYSILMVELVFGATSQNSSPGLHFPLLEVFV